MDSDASMDSDGERYAYGDPYGVWDSDDEYAAMGVFDHYYEDDHDDYDDYEYEEGEVDEEMEPPQPTRRRAPTPPPSAPLAPPPPTLCRFFVLGKCRYGSRCTFSHTLPTTATGNGEDGREDAMAQAAATLVDCPYFLRGNCKYGARCRLRHAPSGSTASHRNGGGNQRDHAATAARATSSASSSATATPRAASADNQQEYTCGICFEDIVEAGKHFGLLSCDHCFCLDCLRSWRQAKDMEVEVTRACPACRVPSNYIVPSLTFCTGAEKIAAVDAYKRHLAIRECKYFDGSFGSCPFGSNCFYAHRNARGEDVKHMDRPRRSRRRSGSVESGTSSSIGGGSSRGGARGSRRGGGGGRPYPDSLSSILERYNDFFRFLESFEWEERASRQETH